MKKKKLNKRGIIISIYIGFCSVLFSCVNDINKIKTVTYDPKSPDDVTENLEIIQTDSGYAKFQLFAKLAETYSKPEVVTKLKDGLKVNFFSKDGKIISTLTALYGEINMAKGTFFVKDSVQLFNIEKKQKLETEIMFCSLNDSTVFTDKAVIVRNPQGILFGNGLRTKLDFSSYVFIKPTGKIDFDKK